jgi:hypothetical protein
MDRLFVDDRPNNYRSARQRYCTRRQRPVTSKETQTIARKLRNGRVVGVAETSDTCCDLCEDALQIAAFEIAAKIPGVAAC